MYIPICLIFKVLSTLKFIPFLKQIVKVHNYYITNCVKGRMPFCVWLVLTILQNMTLMNINCIA